MKIPHKFITVTCLLLKIMSLSKPVLAAIL
jgi:hypothetical protein